MRAPNYKKFTYANRGITIAVGTRIGEYTFKDNLIDVKKNTANWTYDYFVTSDTKDSKIDYFIKFWGKQFRVFKIDAE